MTENTQPSIPGPPRYRRSRRHGQARYAEDLKPTGWIPLASRRFADATHPLVGHCQLQAASGRPARRGEGDQMRAEASARCHRRQGLDAAPEGVNSRWPVFSAQRAGSVSRSRRRGNGQERQDRRYPVSKNEDSDAHVSSAGEEISLRHRPQPLIAPSSTGTPICTPWSWPRPPSHPPHRPQDLRSAAPL
jgi:hypothetical protein